MRCHRLTRNQPGPKAFCTHPATYLSKARSNISDLKSSVVKLTESSSKQHQRNYNQTPGHAVSSRCCKDKQSQIPASRTASRIRMKDPSLKACSIASNTTSIQRQNCSSLFCSRDCCLCTKHQSVKELRHAGSKGKNKHKENQTKATKKHKKTNHKNKKNATTQLPFAAGETGETGETETTPSKKTVGPTLLRGSRHSSRKRMGAH